MITLAQVTKILKENENFHEIIIEGHYLWDYDGSVKFDKLSYDSRQTTAGTLFFAKGNHFKKEFLSNLTAAFYISEIDYEVEIPAIIVSNVKRAMALIAQAFYDYPQNKLKTLALTGTKGKTTSAYFAKNILDEHNGGKTALLSTVQTTLDGQNYFKSKLTTPESLDLIEMMATAVKNGMTHLIMEVASQAYLTERVYGLTFDVGVFLNFSADHIGPEEHPTMENYFYCKSQLIEHSRFFVANSEATHFDFLKAKIGNLPHSFYGEHSENRIVSSGELTFSTSGLIADEFEIRLIGKFNQENALATALATKALGAELSDIKTGLAKTIVPGRMQTLDTPTGAKIYIDYAHNGFSLENLLQVVEAHQPGKISLVLGATGSKGENRRHDFGRVLEQHPQIHVYLTTDDCGEEDPKVIADAIASHISRPVHYEADREQAIKQAITATTGPKDAVIIAGKGTDKFQWIKGQREPYIGDVEAAQRALN